MIEYIKKTNSKNDLVGVEIGVYYGTHAKNILESLPIKMLYLIDPYETYVEKGILWNAEYKNIYAEANKKLEKYKEKVKFIKRKSQDAVGLIPDSLDFVYIDGNHTFKAVKKDIELYYPKVKNGGVIGQIGACGIPVEFDYCYVHFKHFSINPAGKPCAGSVSHCRSLFMVSRCT